MSVRRLARGLAVLVLGLVTAVLLVCSLAVALVGFGHAAPSGTATLAPPVPASSCWVEHKPADLGGDEEVCGDPRLMPAGATRVLIGA